MTKLSRPPKPGVRPAKPKEPKKPEQFYTWRANDGYAYVGSSDSTVLPIDKWNSLIEKHKDQDPKLVAKPHNDYYSCHCSGIDSVTIQVEWTEICEDTCYHKKQIKYEEHILKYEGKLKRYEERLVEWNAKKKAYDAWEKENRIDELKKELLREAKKSGIVIEITGA